MPTGERRWTMRQRRRGQQGFTYLGLLALLSVLLLWTTVAMEVSTTAVRRDKEAELLFVGEQYRSALMNYYRAVGRFPNSLSEMLDSRTRGGQPQRFLRRLYIDPITGSKEWGLIKNPLGGIQGVYSLSELKPLKQANFDLGGSTFANASKYTEWKFMISGVAAIRP